MGAYQSWIKWANYLYTRHRTRLVGYRHAHFEIKPYLLCGFVSLSSSRQESIPSSWTFRRPDSPYPEPTTFREDGGVTCSRGDGAWGWSVNSPESSYPGETIPSQWLHYIGPNPYGIQVYTKQGWCCWDNHEPSWYNLDHHRR